MKKKNLLMLLFVPCLIALAACTNSTSLPTKTITVQSTLPTATKEAPATATITVSETAVIEEEGAQEALTATAVPSITPDSRPDPVDWMNWPVVPTISAHALDIYLLGLENGNDPNHFSKIGDCQNVTSYFLADFDKGRYTLGDEYAYLQEVIDYYEGSWKRESLAVKGGFNVASILNPMFSDPELCDADESPLTCELRVNQPSVVLISMETWWNHDDPTKYEFYMRKVLDEVIAYGALPILATKADNLEGDHIINRAIAQLAYEYDIPMWNFWAAVDPLPDHGLNEDGFHLTLGLGNYFDDPDNNAGAWPIRNLTALQTMDAVYQAVNGIE